MPIGHFSAKIYNIMYLQKTRDWPQQGPRMPRKHSIELDPVAIAGLHGFCSSRGSGKSVK